MLTFVIAASRDSSPLSPDMRTSVVALDARSLLHVPEDELTFHDDDHRLSFRAWHTPDPGTGWAQWHRTADAIAALAGWSWPLDGRPVDLDWLGDVAARPERLDRHLDQLAGAFAIVRADRDGRARVAADRSGGGLVHVATTEDAIVAGSRPDVVAAVVARGPVPARDDDAAAWLPALGFLGDDRTTFPGVRVLDADAHVDVDRSGARIVHGTPPWRSDAPPPTHDEVAERLVQLVTAAAHHPADEKLFLLSGGRDSRTLLAAAAEAGVADRFDLVTFGYEGHQDVVAARLVADHLGLDVRRVEPPTHDLDAESFLRMARAHVGMTAGAFGLWDLKTLHPTWALRVTGLGGGFLHSLARPLSPDGDHETLTDELLDAIRFDAGGLLRPSVRAALRDRVRDWVVDELAAGADPADLADVYYADVHRRRWIGAAQEVNTWGAQLAPLLDETLIRSGLTASAEDRATGMHSLKILRTLRPDLSRLPLANHGWSAECVARYPDVDVAPIRAQAERPVDWHDRCWPQIEPVFREHLEQHANPRLHALVQVDAVRDALDRHGRLDAHTKAQLWATLGAAIWLSGTDTTVRYPPSSDPAEPTERDRLLAQVAALQDVAASAEARAERATAELDRLRSRRVVRTGLAAADTLGRVARRIRP